MLKNNAMLKSIKSIIKPYYKFTLLSIRFFLSYMKMLLYLLVGRTKDNYCIKTQYLTRRNNKHFDDRENTDQHQDKVYTAAHDFFVENKLTKILDIGCGSGFKLIKYFEEFDTTGLELPPALGHLRKKYPDRKWEYSDFSKVPKSEYDMTIAVDVIEHLRDPDELLNFIGKINTKYILISTPDRSKLPFRSQIGPPGNRCHVREWSKEEFVEYISKYFNVIESKVVSYQEHYIIAKKKHNTL